jgi:hypothetical protein
VDLRWEADLLWAEEECVFDFEAADFADGDPEFDFEGDEA